MINYIVDKTINRTKSNQDNEQPVFMINYCTINPNQKLIERFTETNNNHLKKPHNISNKNNDPFLKLKSKTLQKLKDFRNFHRNDLISIGTHKALKKINFQQKQKQKNKKIITSNPQQDDQQNLLLNFNHQSKKISTSTVSKSVNISPQKPLYLLYKDQKNQRQNKNNIGIAHMYQRKYIANQNDKRMGKTISFIDFNCEIEDKFIQNQKIKRNFFLNTLQYRNNNKEKINQFNQSNTKILMKTLVNFNELKQEQKINENLNQSNLLNGLTNKFKSKQKQKNNQIKIRNIYTQKRDRKIVNQSKFNNYQMKKMSFQQDKDTYRPWSPIKTNPTLGIINEDELLYQKSKTFDIFMNIMNKTQ